MKAASPTVGALLKVVCRRRVGLGVRPCQSSAAVDARTCGWIHVGGVRYATDEWTNVPPKVLSSVGRSLLDEPANPLHLLRRRIARHFAGAYRKPASTSPVFALLDRPPPVVSVWENFDSLLVPADHPSRSRADTYYVNAERLLRAHTSAHQHSLIASGLDAFLIAADVYRRDAVDRTHSAVFHQMEGVRLFSRDQLFGAQRAQSALALFEAPSARTSCKQERHTQDASVLVEKDLKDCLGRLVRQLYGHDICYRWVDVYFPFTHPSWELEIFESGDWIETLGCGIVEQALLDSAGAQSKVGWAFGLGLERLAMKLYSIPDIRLFWSLDERFLSQFRAVDPDAALTYRPISQYLPVNLDVSFWLPQDAPFHCNDFYETVRTIGGDLVEEVRLFDEFQHPQTKKRSQAWTITYRHMDKAIPKDEANELHKEILRQCELRLKVTVR